MQSQNALGNLNLKQLGITKYDGEIHLKNSTTNFGPTTFVAYWLAGCRRIGTAESIYECVRPNRSDALSRFV